MLKTIIVLPDGAELSSGNGNTNAIKSVKLTQSVNKGQELTLGSTCSNSLEATLFAPGGKLSLVAGSEVTVYREQDGTRKPAGVFILEKPTHPTANTVKISGYDRVSKLDKDLTAWLSGLAGWPYTLITFAGMVCSACGLTLKTTSVPNGTFQIEKFSRSYVTGRQLMQWLSEICCRFCRADPDGDIEFAWYVDSGVAIKPNGEHFYFQGGLSYEDYTVAPIEEVQLRLADSENGALWPAAVEGTNSYVISGNPILNSRVTDDLAPVLANIKAELSGMNYTPCSVTIPANMDIHVGNTVQITDINGVTITAYVMKKTQTGQKDKLECVGSRRRDSSPAVYEQPAQNVSGVLDNCTQEQLFNKLTNDGKIKGIFSKNGIWVINADVAEIANLVANVIKSGILQSEDGGVWIDLDKGEGNLTRGTSAYLSTFDEYMGGWTKNVDDVIREFVTVELNKMRTNTVRDYAAALDTNGEYPEGVKLSLHKIRQLSGQLLASISFEWVDGSRSHMIATADAGELEGGYTEEAVWEFSEMTWS